MRALANSTYADSVAAMDAATRRGDVPASVSSLDGFVRAAMLARSAGGDPIARGFEILASVAQPYFTRWSIVYDLGAGEIHFRTDGNRGIRRVSLPGLDFSCATPVAMLDATASARCREGRPRRASGADVVLRATPLTAAPARRRPPGIEFRPRHTRHDGREEGARWIWDFGGDTRS